MVLLASQPLLSAAKYSRIDVDVSALPPEKSFIANIVRSRVYERTPPSREGGLFRVKFSMDRSLLGERASVRIGDGCAVVCGARFRSLVFGAGKLLRAIRYETNTFDVPDGMWVFSPSNAIRQVYLARHFNTWYHRASVEELSRYIDDLALCGMNSIKTFTSVAAVDQAYSGETEREIFEATTHALVKHVKDLDLDFSVGGGSNVSGRPIATSMRANRYGPDVMRGFSDFSICPEKPGGLERLLDERCAGLKSMENLAVDEFVYWPYDEGGCACEKCSPWGGRGYLKLIERLSALNRVAYPHARHVVSTWLFDDDDWKGLYRYLQTHVWIDSLLVDSHDTFPEFPLRHPVPRNIPIITFPEVSMWGRFPWGGTGATPLPRRFERLFRQAEPVASGFSIYSEGLFDDISKFEIAALYIDPKTAYHNILAEYCRYEFPGADAADFVHLCEMLEDIHCTALNPHAHAGDTSNNSFANYVKFANSAELSRRTEVAAQAVTLAQKIESLMLPVRRKCWRWRQIALRTRIDAAVYRERNIRAEAAVEAYRELLELYHAERQYRLMCEGCPFAGYTCPPLIDHLETTKRKEW